MRQVCRVYELNNAALNIYNTQIPKLMNILYKARHYTIHQLLKGKQLEPIKETTRKIVYIIKISQFLRHLYYSIEFYSGLIVYSHAQFLKICLS